MFIGDEIKSTVSDTWSTDVLGSDSEPPENQLDRLDEIAEEMVRHNMLGVHMVDVRTPLSFANYSCACFTLIVLFVIQNFEETASDAWSTDVLASDTSELQVILEFMASEVTSLYSHDTGVLLLAGGASSGARSGGRVECWKSKSDARRSQRSTRCFYQLRCHCQPWHSSALK